LPAARAVGMYIGCTVAAPEAVEIKSSSTQAPGTFMAGILAAPVHPGLCVSVPIHESGF